MPINNRELMQAISMVADNAQVRVCVKQSGRGALVCGAMCMAGGLLLGPPGLAIGGTIGGLTAYRMTSGTFRPVSEILMNDLTEQQTEQLVRHVQLAVADVGVEDLALLIPLLASASGAGVQTAVLRTVTSFITNELRMQIVD